MDFIRKHWVPIGAAAVVVLVAIIVWSISNGVTNTGNRKESALNAQYSNNQNILSNCIIRIRETAGIAKGQTNALDRIITDAVKGRYGGDTTAKIGQGQLFSAIKEAYPDLNNLGVTFGKVLDITNGCRSDFAGQQSKTLDMLRDFDGWRTGSLTVRTFGGDFPNHNLIARVGIDETHGDDAEKQMWRIILVGDALKDYQTGKVVPEDPFGTNN